MNIRWLPTVAVGLVLMSMVGLVHSEVTYVVHHVSGFNSVPPGWGANTRDGMAAEGWGQGGLGTNFKEVRGDDWCPEDGTPPPPYIPSQGQMLQFGYYDWVWLTPLDPNGSPTGSAGAYEVLSYWHKGLNLDDQNTRGNRQRIGEADASTTNVNIWEETDIVGGIELWYDNRSGTDARRWQLLDGDYGEREFYLPAVGGGDFVRTSGVWYNIVVEFDVPGGTYDLKVYDEAGVHVAGHAGNTKGTMTKLNHYGALEYNGPIAVTTKLDHFKFISGEEVPPPSNCLEARGRGYSMDSDLNLDCHVNLLDFSIIAAGWLECIDPAVGSCERPWESD